MIIFPALLSVTNRKRLLKEVSLMISFNHPNVMSLIGMCFDGEVPLLILPFMSGGSVLDYVTQNRGNLHFIDDTLGELSMSTSLGELVLLRKPTSLVHTFNIIELKNNASLHNLYFNMNEVVNVHACTRLNFAVKLVDLNNNFPAGFQC